MEPGAEVREISVGDLRDNIRVELLDAVVHNVVAHFHELTFADGFRLEIDAELLPVVPDNGDDDMIFRDVAIVFVLESSNSVVEFLESVTSVLFDPAGVHESLGVIDDLIGTLSLVRQDSDEIGESLVAVRVVFAHIVDLLSVEPSLRVGNVGVVGEKVHADGDRLGARGGDGFEFHSGDDSLREILFGELRLLLCAEIGRHFGGEDMLGVLHVDNNPLREVGAGCIAFEDDAADKFGCGGGCIFLCLFSEFGDFRLG